MREVDFVVVSVVDLLYPIVMVCSPPALPNFTLTSKLPVVDDPADHVSVVDDDVESSLDREKDEEVKV